MFYRHKLLLSLLTQFPQGIGTTRLHKLMFLCVLEMKASPVYDFVPYKFGGFSFVLRQDLATLLRQGWVSRTETAAGVEWKLADEIPSLSLKKNDQKSIDQLVESYGRHSRGELIRHSYQLSPYHAIHSEVAESYLDPIGLAKVKAARPTWSLREAPALFTIGYEGISLDTYLNKLIQNGVRLLCDVRKNAFSMKWGFSLRQLKPACEAVGIEYIHLPDLGIESAQRQHLETQMDRDTLFMRYETETLPAQTAALEELITHLHAYERVAITCFEREVCQCHRGTLASFLAKQGTLEVIHL